MQIEKYLCSNQKIWEGFQAWIYRHQIQSPFDVSVDHCKLDIIKKNLSNTTEDMCREWVSGKNVFILDT